MNRFFGKSSKKPDVSLTDAISAVKYTTLNRKILNGLFLQVDGRVESIDAKIKKLDIELNQCKDKLSKLPEGPSKVTHESYFSNNLN